MDFGLADGDGHFDAEVFAPHRLQRFEHGDLRRGPRGELEAGEVFSARETGLGQEARGERGIEARLPRRRFTCHERGIGGHGRKILRRRLSTASDAFDDFFPVDRERERAADAGVVEGWALRVEGKVAGFGEGRAVEFSGAVALVGFNFGERDGHRDVDLPGAVGAFLGVAAVEADELDLVEMHGGGCAIAGVFLNDDALLLAPFGEGEGTVADEVTGLRPSAAVLGDGAGIDREPRAAGDVVGETW